MSKEKIILSDIDGVMLNWIDRFTEYVGERGYEEYPNSRHEFELTKRYNLTSNEARALATEFNESIEMLRLKPLADAQYWVKKLAYLGFRFIAITSITDCPNAKQYRESNLFDVFGDVFDNVICLPIGSSKGHILEQWQDSGLFWIEDHFQNAEAGYEVGLKSILVDAPYNKHYQTDLFPRVSRETPWQEIYQIVMKEYDL